MKKAASRLEFETARIVIKSARSGKRGGCPVPSPLPLPNPTLMHQGNEDFKFILYFGDKFIY
jgi:hypothetical protein